MLSAHELNRALVDAFNVHNYGSNVDTNFFTDGSNIVVIFGGNEASGKEYLEFMGEEVRREHFSSKKDSNVIFDLDSFPFKFDKGKWKQDENDKKKEIVRFVIPASQAVISNLQYHFTIERVGVIAGQMTRELVHYGYDREEAQDYVKKSIVYNKVHRGFRESFRKGSHGSCLRLSFGGEGFMNNFIQKYKADMEWSNDDFLKRWKVNGLNMYEKNIMLQDIELATRKTRELIGRFFDTSSSENERVKRYKNAISDLIFRETGIPISSYYRDIFVDQDRKNNGEHFAFIPEVGGWTDKTYLNCEEVDKINNALGFSLLSNVEGQTAETQSCRNGGIYALTNKQITFLIPEIIRKSAITKIDDSYGLAIDYDQQRSRSSSTVTSPLNSPIHAGPSGLRTPPNQRGRDSGYDSNSPPRPEDSGSPSGDPRSSFEEIQKPQSCFPRQVHHHLGAAEVGAAQNVQGACGRSLAPLAKPEDTRGDLESNDECSKAKPQKSESPKEHGGGFKSKIKRFFSSKPKQQEASLK